MASPTQWIWVWANSGRQRRTEGQRSLARCSPWGVKELDTSEWLNNIKEWMRLCSNNKKIQSFSVLIQQKWVSFPAARFMSCAGLWGWREGFGLYSHSETQFVRGSAISIWTSQNSQFLSCLIRGMGLMNSAWTFHCLIPDMAHITFQWPELLIVTRS